MTNKYKTKQREVEAVLVGSDSLDALVDIPKWLEILLEKQPKELNAIYKSISDGTWRLNIAGKIVKILPGDYIVKDSASVLIVPEETFDIYYEKSGE